MLTTIIATTVLATPQSTDSLTSFLPDAIADSLPYVMTNIKGEFTHVQKLRDSASDVFWHYEPTNTTLGAIGYRLDAIPTATNDQTRTEFSMSLQSSQHPMYRVASELKRLGHLRSRNENKLTQAELHGLYLPLNIGDISFIRLHSDLPRSSELKRKDTDQDMFETWVDLNGSFLKLTAYGQLFKHQLDADIDFMTTVTRRATSFALGEGKSQPVTIQLPDLEVPGRQFSVYPNRMVNWNFYAKEKDISWQYLPNSASIQIKGKAPIQLLLGTRTYKIGQDELVADAPVTIHNQEFYIEENAMSKILEALS